jgi:hypothetical protein
MDLNEIKINESNKQLDSFIFSLEKKLIEDKHLLAKLNDIKLTEVSQKRTGRKLNVPDLESVQSCLKVAEYIGSATISQNIDIIQAVEKLKIEKLGNWFTNSADIRKEFELINSSANFRINPFDVFDQILALNTCKVYVELINHYWPKWEGRNNNSILDAVINMEETKRKRIREGRLPATNKEEQEADEKLAKLKADFDNAGIKNSHIDLLKGNFDSPFIRYIFNQIQSIQIVSESQKKLVAFPLLKLVLKDRRLLTEKEFYSTKSPLPTYEDYMILTVSNLLNLK